MATNIKNNLRAYGIGDDLIKLAPKPIKAKRNPKSDDFAPIGSPWLNTEEKVSFILSDSSSNVANWNVVGGIAGSATAASPTAAVTINEKSFKAVFTGFTTAAAGTQQFTINNNKHLTTTEPLQISLSNNGTNDAQMTITRINQNTAGQIVVTATNNGAAALNGDVIITGSINS